MNIEIMRKHYERTPKKTLINVLVASREQVDKLQKRNKEYKQEIERLKGLCDKYEEEHKTTFEEWKKTINIIKEVREYIESIEKVDCRYFNYNRALKEMLISYEDLKKKVEEDGTLEGHFIEINKLKLLEILDKVDKE